MSADLTWQIIRNNSAFLRRQRGINKTFSTEKFNLAKKNSIRFNGLVNKRGIDVAPAADGKGIVISTKVQGKTNVPAQSVSVTKVKNVHKALRALKGVSKNLGLAPFTKLAQRRASVFIRSQQPKPKKNVKKTEA